MSKILRILLFLLFSTNLVAGDFVVARKIPLTTKSQEISKVVELFASLEQLSIEHNMSTYGLFERIKELSSKFKKFDRVYKLGDSVDEELRFYGKNVRLWCGLFDVMLFHYRTTPKVEYDHKYVINLRKEIKKSFVDKDLDFEFLESTLRIFINQTKCPEVWYKRCAQLFE